MLRRCWLPSVSAASARPRGARRDGRRNRVRGREAPDGTDSRHRRGALVARLCEVQRRSECRTTVHSWVDVLVLGWFLDQSAIGVYEIAWRVAGVTTLLAGAIGTSRVGLLGAATATTLSLSVYTSGPGISGSAPRSDSPCRNVGWCVVAAAMAAVVGTARSVLTRETFCNCSRWSASGHWSPLGMLVSPRYERSCSTTLRASSPPLCSDKCAFFLLRINDLSKYIFCKYGFVIDCSRR